MKEIESTQTICKVLIQCNYNSLNILILEMMSLIHQLWEVILLVKYQIENIYNIMHLTDRKQIRNFKLYIVNSNMFYQNDGLSLDFWVLLELSYKILKELENRQLSWEELKIGQKTHFNKEDLMEQINTKYINI